MDTSYINNEDCFQTVSLGPGKSSCSLLGPALLRMLSGLPTGVDGIKCCFLDHFCYMDLLHSLPQFSAFIDLFTGRPVLLEVECIFSMKNSTSKGWLRCSLLWMLACGRLGFLCVLTGGLRLRNITVGMKRMELGGM